MGFQVLFMKRICLLLGMLCALCVWSCKETAQEITLSETQVSLYVGEKVALEANALVDWMSDDAFYASVNAEGEVLAQHVGTTTIVAQGADGGRAACTVTVKPYFNTFTEPCLEAFGQSVAILKAVETRQLIREEEQAVIYAGKAPVAEVRYQLGAPDGSVTSAIVTLDVAVREEMQAFFGERYDAYGAAPAGGMAYEMHAVPVVLWFGNEATSDDGKHFMVQYTATTEMDF